MLGTLYVYISTAPMVPSSCLSYKYIHIRGKSRVGKLYHKHIQKSRHHRFRLSRPGWILANRFSFANRGTAPKACGKTGMKHDQPQINTSVLYSTVLGLVISD